MTFGTSTSSSKPMIAIRLAVAALIAIAAAPVSTAGAATQRPQERPKKPVPVCPKQIPPSDVSVKWPAGWHGEVTELFRLRAVGVIWGKEPSHLGDFIPETEERKGKLVVYYSGLDGYDPHPRWLSCSYGRDTVLRLYKPLSSDIKECVIRYTQQSASPGHYDLESYRCE